jgi:hypothetical protein
MERQLATVTASIYTPLRALLARELAVGYCQGTPLRNEIEARDPGEAVEMLARQFAHRYGDGPNRRPHARPYRDRYP